MIAAVTLLLAFPCGYFFRSHLAANTAYAIAYLWAFVFQGLYLTRSWVGGDDSAFPKDPDTLPVSYGIVSLVIFGVGFGLVALGRRVGAGRRNRQLVDA
ncbi:MAG: hypothetical protein JWR27_3104 [Aeromicrobium sp.]|jgi:hypothetical protein|nr:hypothetical protein [Aeromicrobium sp.]MCW2788175.1 hypothetical protein [Aeromicrobium sp.]